MLKQHDFVFGSMGIENVHSEIAVKIQGMLMHIIPQEIAMQMHENKYHPYAIYCVPQDNGQKILTRVSSLDALGDIFIEAVSKLNYVYIQGMGKVKIIGRGETFTSDLSSIVRSLNGRRFRLAFITPSVFKIKGNETSFPDVTMHFLSVIRKMNEFECVNIDFDLFRKSYYRCKINDWRFYSHTYNVSGIMVPGMTGYVDVVLPNDPAQQLLKKVFAYASFSGTGGRTGMGMGGFVFQAL